MRNMRGGVKNAFYVLKVETKSTLTPPPLRKNQENAKNAKNRKKSVTNIQTHGKSPIIVLTMIPDILFSEFLTQSSFYSEHVCR